MAPAPRQPIQQAVEKRRSGWHYLGYQEFLQSILLPDDWESIEKCGAVGRQPSCQLTWEAVLVRESDAPASCYGERVSTGFVESAVNQLLAKRFVKRQQMLWTKKGAH